MKPGLKHAAAVVAICLVHAFAAPGASPAQGSGSGSDSRGETFVTKHTGTFNGVKLAYTAAVAPTRVSDEEGREVATFYSIAYLRDDVTDRTVRPVLFLFNGGPGAASVYLHMGAFGPKKVVLPDDIDAEVGPPYETSDNPHTILDVADLVFIDPPGTGFSRVAAGRDPKSLYTAASDAKAVARFIEAWSKANGREKSPRYVMGESYGTIRAVLVADELKESSPLDGVILFGQAVNIVETVQRAGNIVGYAVNLPSLSALAWYHNLIPREGKTLDSLLEEAYAFGVGDYLLALAKGRELPEGERRAVAARLEELTGLDAGYYLSNGLVISKQQYRREFLKHKGLVAGMYDGRYTAPPGGPDPSMKYSEAFAAALRRHLAEELGVTLEDEYRASDRAAAAAWDYGRGAASSPFSDFDFPEAITRAMAANPAFRLMIGTGVYDTSTTTGAARYLVARGTFPRARVTLRTYEGGHMAYTNKAALVALTNDVRDFVTGK